MEPAIKGNRFGKDVEGAVREKWKAKWPYHFDVKSRKPIFSIDTPPPYVNTPVHIGQATTYVLMDMFARFRRMKGYEVLFPLGLDRNGLPIEMAAEKKFGAKLTTLPREKAIEYCNKILEEASLASVDSFERLGISFNSWKKGPGIGELYETDSPDYRSLTQETFIDMLAKGLIYEDERVNNFCPGCQTTLADAEVDYENRAGIYYHVRFGVKETGEDVIIATTRPELICTLGMIIFNPQDGRYKHLEGKTAISPIFGKAVPIKSHPSAEIERGTGIMMVCSFGDLADIRFFREQNLPAVIAIGKDGRMNENAGFLAGLSVKQARGKMVEELDKLDLIVEKVQTNDHRTPICERSKDAIEFIAMPEFYVKQVEFKGDMKKLAKKLSFYSPRSRQIMLDWIDSVSIDWPISRRRFYATEVPLWYCGKCGEKVIPPKGKYYQPWKQKPPAGSEGLSESGKCAKCGHGKFRGEERVFDTWFDSSISPLYIMKYHKEPAGFFERARPCSLRPQGKEIVRTWLYYTVLKDWLLTDECIFRDVWVNYHILDEKGKKMSKSLGNVIDPHQVLERSGAEPFRLWAAIEGNLEKTDFRCSFERIDGAGKTLTKLWNVARFVSMFPAPEKKPGKLCPLDEWILSETDELVRYADERYGKYDFHNPGTRIKNFIWEAFSSHYVELAKQRAYNQDGKFSKAEQDSARYALNHVLDKLMLILAPVVPFLTYSVYMDLRGKDIHMEPFPVVEKAVAAKPAKGKSKEKGKDKPGKKALAAFTSQDIMDFNSAVWKEKKERGLSLRDPVKSAVIPQKLAAVAADLCATHGIGEMKRGKKISLSFEPAVPAK
jgi:valyl-tRNA synthetase